MITFMNRAITAFLLIMLTALAEFGVAVGHKAMLKQMPYFHKQACMYVTGGASSYNKNRQSLLLCQLICTC